MSAGRVIATVLLIGGVALQVIAVIGVAVMRNAYDRLHYVGLVGFGALLVAASILVREGFSLIGDKAIVIGVLVVVFGPVLMHTTARSLRIREHGDWRPGAEQGAEERKRR